MQEFFERELGCIPYRDAWSIQERLLSRVVDGFPSTLLTCEHPHVISLGTRSDSKHLLLSESAFQELGAEVVQSNRGGDVTYHGPGQLVAYPVFSLEQCPCGRDLHAFLRLLEMSLIDLLGHFGIQAFAVEGKTGVWTDHGKIAAIGLRSSRWVTMHGFALNVNPDLAWFSRIVPCGLQEPVTSLAEVLADEAPSVKQLRTKALEALERRFECRFTPLVDDDFNLEMDLDPR